MSHNHSHYSQYNHNGVVPQVSQLPLSQGTPTYPPAPRHSITPPQQHPYLGRAPQNGMQANRPISRPEPIVRAPVPMSQHQIPLSQSAPSNANPVSASSQISFSQNIQSSQSSIQLNRQPQHAQSQHPRPQYMSNFSLSQQTNVQSPRAQSNVAPSKPHMYQQSPQPQLSQQTSNQYGQHISYPPLSQSSRPAPAASTTHLNSFPSSQPQQYQPQKQHNNMSSATSNQSVLSMQPPPPRPTMTTTPISAVYPPPPPSPVTAHGYEATLYCLHILVSSQQKMYVFGFLIGLMSPLTDHFLETSRRKFQIATTTYEIKSRKLRIKNCTNEK